MELIDHVVQINNSLTLDLNGHSQAQNQITSFCASTESCIYVGNSLGILLEYSFANNLWNQTKSIHHEGPITNIFTIENWLFIAIKLSSAFGLVKAYNLTSGEVFPLKNNGYYYSHQLSVNCICVFEGFLITGGGDGQVNAWNYEKSINCWKLHGMITINNAAHDSGITCINSKLTGMLITSGMRGDLKIWSLTKGNINTCQAHVGVLVALDVFRVDEKNQFILTCGLNDHWIRLWNTPKLEMLMEIIVLPQMSGITPQSDSHMTSIKVMENNFEIFVGFSNGSVHCYQLKESIGFVKLGNIVHGGGSSCQILSICSISKFLCIATENGLVRWFHYTLDSDTSILPQVLDLLNKRDFINVSNLIKDCHDKQVALQVLISICEFTKDVLSHRERRSSIGNTPGMLQAIIDLIVFHSHDKDVSRYGLEALRNLAFVIDDETNQLEIASKGGIKLTIEALLIHQNDKAVVQYACLLLRLLAYKNEEKIKIASLGGIRIVIETMKAHKNDPNVVSAACWALKTLVDDSTLFSRESMDSRNNKLEIVNLGGIELLIQVLNIHKADVSVSYAGCSTLENLADENEPNQIKIASHGGIKAILDAMTIHKNIEGISQTGCLTLKDLCKNKSLVPIIKTLKAKEVVKNCAPNWFKDSCLKKLDEI